MTLELGPKIFEPVGNATETVLKLPEKPFEHFVRDCRSGIGNV